MNSTIVDSLEPITLVGGGDIGPDDLKAARMIGPNCVAVDGGAGALLKNDVVPQAVIGDFDSLSGTDQSRLPPDRLFLIEEQDSTDFDKALRHMQAPLLLGVGFLGGRVDHQLAVLNTLVRRPDRAVILIGAEDVICHVPRQFTLSFEKEERVSLMPFASVTAQSEGLQWPIDALTLDPAGQISTSNAASGPVTLRPSAPGLLMLIERARLSDLAATFLQLSPSQLWPAPA